MESLYLEVMVEGHVQTVRFDRGFALSCGDERYELKYGIKSGGNGVVFEADRYVQGRHRARCAVKMLRRLDDQRVDRFQNEVRVMKELGSHPRVSQIAGAGEHVSDRFVVPWLAMDLGAENLRQRVLPVVDRTPQPPTPLTPEVLVPFCVQVCEAVQHVHDRGFVHRDIKPDNFVLRKGKNEIVMIDFGLAKRVGEDVSGRPLDQFTRTMEFVGPTFFASPELIAYARDKEHEVGPRSDLFMVGKVMWFLGTGVILAGVPSKRQDPLGGKLHALVMDLISQQPEDRPATAQELIGVLSSW